MKFQDGISNLHTNTHTHTHTHTYTHMHTDKPKPIFPHLFKVGGINRPKMFTFKELITRENEKEVSYLGIYISEAFVLRRNAVYITDLV